VRYPISYFLPHLVLLGAYIAALVPVLYYYRRRNPNPRFRPTLGEMTMITVIALMVGGTACWFLGNIFRGDQNLNKYLESPNEGAGWSHGTSGSQDEGDSSGGK
jgi:hypothetical protein